MKRNEFKLGDFIKNKDPYDGEGEYMVIEIDFEQEEYKCGRMQSKHNKEIDLKNRMVFTFEKAHEYYEKVG